MIQNTLINEKWLKEFSPIPLNYNLKELHNYIKLAETIWVEPLIGSEFYDELLDQVANNNLTDVNSTALVEAIYPYLGFAVAYEALPIMWAHISEVGITKGKSDNSDSLDLKDITYMSQHLRAQVEARKDYCKKWLCQRFEYFQDLDVCGCGCDCCNNTASLKSPNPNYMVYKPIKKNTNLR
jgi:hypothetical protein